MATATVTTPMHGTKDDLDTPTHAAFLALMPVFRAACAADAQVDGFGVACMSQQFSADFRRAERLRERMIACSFDVLEPKPETSSDLRLQALASALTRVFMLNDARAQQAHLKSIREKTLNFMAAHPDPDIRIEALQHAFLDALEKMAALREFGGDGHVCQLDKSSGVIPA
jgi:hypothetical protein